MLKKPTLTPEMRAELDALVGTRPDVSDREEFDDGNWQGAVRGMFKFQQHYRKAKNEYAQEIIDLFDDDVIELLIQHNNATDYKRINGVLRSMLATA